MERTCIGRREEWQEQGRALGADYARLGMPLPSDAPSSAIEGFRAATLAGFRPRTLDRFQKKWLQLRMGALRRERLVVPEVTPDFLQCIDSPSCPVLRIELTYGERRDTDWSVDRVNNDGAYAPTNLVVMSTRANAAKGSLSYREVRARSKAAGPTDGLSPEEWLRMACVMYGACHVDTSIPREWLPLATAIPNYSIWSAELALQDLLLRASTTFKETNRILREFRTFQASDAHHQCLAGVLERLHFLKKDLKWEHDALLDETVQRDVKLWYATVPRARLPRLRKSLERLYGGATLRPTDWKKVSTETKGYLEFS